MDIIDNYRQRSSAAQIEADRYKKLANTYSLYRLGVFGLFILSVCVAVSLDQLIVIAFALAALVVCFSRLINKQNGFETLANYHLCLKKVNDNEIACIQERTNIYNDGEMFASDRHNYSADLDIYGPRSLFQLMNRAATFPGIVKLAGWLHEPAAKDLILSRQQAVIEIAGKNSWRLAMQAHLVFSLQQQQEQISNLVSYLKIPVELKDVKWLALYVGVAPWLLAGVILAGILYLPALYLVPVVMLVNNRLVSSRRKDIEKTDLIAGRIGATLHHFVPAFKIIENETWSSAYLENVSAKISSGNTTAVSAKIFQLSRLINKLNYRLNLLVNFFMNALFIWSIRQVIAIEEWKRDNQESLETAFDGLAEYEALISLAVLKVNYPDWCFPEIAGGDGHTLAARSIAHPLIVTKMRVANDYELNDARRIDIITGSNMAGKSTFLRTIGINTVLALCGAPVCAGRMEVSVMNIITYMRIKDSLNESTSTFKAELDRLQMLLKAVETGDKVFFLIDEMLRGTNSVDKYLGSKAVIGQLIRKRGVGMVATHDLQLAELEKDHPGYVRNYYFDIQIKDGEMLFDYKLKNGECKTFNASVLLKQIGIDVEESD